MRRRPARPQELRSHGCDIIAKQQSFRVHGYNGPLLDGELDLRKSRPAGASTQVSR